MGNPLNSGAWLARKLDEFGVTMSPVTQSVGSFIRARTIRPATPSSPTSVPWARSASRVGDAED